MYHWVDKNGARKMYGTDVDQFCRDISSRGYKRELYDSVINSHYRLELVNGHQIEIYKNYMESGINSHFL